MATLPVSVIMAVRNAATTVRESIRSILEQDVELEMVIVNDGSTDGTALALQEEASRDERIRLLHQEHEGLTRALLAACVVSRGRYLARQDAGDVSLPGRLRRQKKVLDERAEVTLVSCASRFLGPAGEHLYDVVQDEEEATARLRTLEVAELAGPSHHGSTMWRRDDYRRVGGYRAEFYFAQDLDLWVRLTERGAHCAIPEIYYEARVTVDSVTALHRSDQLRSRQLIVESARLRREGKSDRPVLDRAARILPALSGTARRRRRSATMYFIGACLRRRGDDRASRYFQRAVAANPLHLKSWLRLFF